MNFDEPTKQYRFPDKQTAQWFAKEIKAKCRIDGRVTIRKSLPEYRHQLCRGFSVFVRAIGLMDTNDIARIYRQVSDGTGR